MADEPITDADIATAKRVANRDIPQLRPALNAELLPPEEEVGRPLPDE